MGYKRLSKGNVLEAVKAAVHDAHKRYEEMSDGWWLQHAPEYLITTEVATRIHKEFNTYVYMEASMRRIWNTENNTEIDGEIIDEHGNDKSSLRSDISIWNRQNNDIYCCIEIKKTSSTDLIEKDIEKLKMIIRANYCKIGIVAAYSSFVKKEKTHEETVRRISDGHGVSGSYEIIKTKLADAEGFIPAVMTFLVEAEIK